MAPKRRVGILGFPKPAATQVMLFGRYAEPLPSDDDSDDDPNFELPEEEEDFSGNETVKGNGRTKRKEGSESSKQKVCNKRKSTVLKPGESDTSSCLESCDEYKQPPTGTPRAADPNKKTKTGHCTKEPNKSNNEHTSLWSDILPAELLVKIFTYAVHCFGVVPFLCRVSRVCQRWRSVAGEPQFWKQVDLSHLGNSQLRYSNSVVTMLCHKRLSAVERLNLDNWTQLTNKTVETIAKHCPYLQSISLWGCANITGTGISALISSCHKLTSIDVSLTKVNMECIRHIVCELGHQLEELYLRNCKSVNGHQVISTIQGACDNLRVLDITGTIVRLLNVEKFQASCPKLRELFLGNLVMFTFSKPNRAYMETSRGFPDLENFSVPCSAHQAFCITDSLVHRFIGLSTKLRVLDLRGCKHVRAEQLKKLPATSLEEIYLSQTDASYITIAVIVEKWSHSLQVLDLSTNSDIGDDSLQLIANFTLPSLTSLDLSGTSVTGNGVRSVLEGCPKLRKLNLSSCRGIPRGLKQHHVQEKFGILVDKLTDI